MIPGENLHDWLGQHASSELARILPYAHFSMPYDEGILNIPVFLLGITHDPSVADVLSGVGVDLSPFKEGLQSWGDQRLPEETVLGYGSDGAVLPNLVGAITFFPGTTRELAVILEAAREKAELRGSKITPLDIFQAILTSSESKTRERLEQILRECGSSLENVKTAIQKFLA